MFLSKKRYPVYESGAIVSFERELRTLYGIVTGLHNYEVIHGKLSKRETRQYLRGKWVMVVDSDGELYSHDAYHLQRIKNPNQVIESLKSKQQKERERGVPVDSQIHFLEHLVEIPVH